jgi:hypothetical protein
VDAALELLRQPLDRHPPVEAPEQLRILVRAPGAARPEPILAAVLRGHRASDAGRRRAGARTTQQTQPHETGEDRDAGPLVPPRNFRDR